MKDLKFRAWDVVKNKMFDVCSLDNTGSYERHWEVREKLPFRSKYIKL